MFPALRAWSRRTASQVTVTRVRSGPSSVNFTVVSIVAGHVGAIGWREMFLVLVAELLRVDEAVGLLDFQILGPCRTFSRLCGPS